MPSKLNKKLVKAAIKEVCNEEGNKIFEEGGAWILAIATALFYIPMIFSSADLFLKASVLIATGLGIIWGEIDGREAKE